MPSPGHGEPTEPGPHQGDRKRIIDGLLSKVAEEHSAAAVSRIVDQLIDDMAGCDPGAKLLKRFGKARALYLDFAFKLLAVAHCPTSIAASPRKHLAGFDE